MRSSTACARASRRSASAASSTGSTPARRRRPTSRRKRTTSTEAEAVCRFHCPPCPSTNNLYLNPAKKGGRRPKSPAYRAWLSEAGWLVKLQRPQAVAGRVRALVEAPFSLRRDLDNIKAVLDLAVGLCLIDDDGCIDDLRVVRTPTGEEMRVTIWPITGLPPPS